MLRFPGSLAESGRVTDFSQLPDILRRERISRVILAEEDAQSRSQLAATLVAPRLGGLLVNDAVDYYEQFFGKIWIDALTASGFSIPVDSKIQIRAFCQALFRSPV